MKLTTRERFLLAVIASGLAVSMFAPSCDPKRVEAGMSELSSRCWTAMMEDWTERVKEEQDNE